MSNWRQQELYLALSCHRLYALLLLYTLLLQTLFLLASTIRLTALEGSNLILKCKINGMWIIEEGDQGGSVRKQYLSSRFINLLLSSYVSSSGTQYTTELILNNLQRNDNRFQKIICSTLNGHKRREYIIDVMCT